MQTTLTCKARLEQYFRDNHVGYMLEHHPMAYTARGVAASEHVSAARVAKSVIVMADGRMTMIVLPASHDVDLPGLAAALGAKSVRLAEEEEFAPAFPDCEVGSMPLFGNLYGLRVYVDATLAKYETIRFEAGTYTDTFCIKYADFTRLVQPTAIANARPHEGVSVLV